MDLQRHKTQKKPNLEIEAEKKDTFKALLDDSTREAYARPWHRIERGLRLNRIRIFIEETGTQYNMTKEEKDGLFLFLQKALDKKLLNTLKVVNYDQEQQRIIGIKGLEIKRNQDGTIRWGFNNKKTRPDSTRKKKRGDENASSENEAVG